MKANREHRVPLSSQAMDLLHNVPRVNGNNHIFPGMKAGRPLSNMSLLQFMRGLGYGTHGEQGNYVPHGFRSSFRDWTGLAKLLAILVMLPRWPWHTLLKIR
ncbi:hypothetical protein P4544_10890 [Halomonas sp. LY9]